MHNIKFQDYKSQDRSSPINIIYVFINLDLVVIINNIHNYHQFIVLSAVYCGCVI